MMRINNLSGRILQDSRGDDTIAVVLETEQGTKVEASVPQGKSTGSYEATALPPKKALASLGEIEDALKDIDFSDQEAVDNRLCELDGTETKKRLGANALLAVSIAASRVGMHARGVSLWEYLRELYGASGTPRQLPRFYMNVMNGGAHAESNTLLVQEFLVMPATRSPRAATEAGEKIYAAVGAALHEQGVSMQKGDEGGYAPDMDDDMAALHLLRSAVGDDMDIGIDAAASGVEMHDEMLLEMYRSMHERYHLSYCEDPFGEDNITAFAALRAEWGEDVIVAGDDLTVTNLKRMRLAHEKRAINGMIVKPNQIGTVTEVLDVVRRAKAWDWTVVVSHRSGETEDDFIADLSVAVEADGIKLGVPVQNERVAKHDRLRVIEEELH